MIPSLNNYLIGSPLILEDKFDVKNKKYTVYYAAKIGGMPRTIKCCFSSSKKNKKSEAIIACFKKLLNLSLQNCPIQNPLRSPSISKQEFSSSNCSQLILMPNNPSFKPGEQVLPSSENEENQVTGENILDHFFNLNDKLQKKYINDPVFFNHFTHLIENADQKKIRNCETGDLLFHMLAKNSLKEIRILSLISLEAGIDINSKNYKNETALHFAAEYGDSTLISTLLEKGAQQFSDIPPPICHALKNNHFSCAMQLAMSDPELHLEELMGAFILHQPIEDLLILLKSFF